MAGGRDAGKPTLRDAVKFIYDVKRVFRDEPGKYDELIQIARDVVTHRVLDEEDGKARMKELMKGHPELLVSFNFLCPDAEIAIQSEAEKEFEEVMCNVICKIKARSQGNDSHLFESYMAIMRTYKQGNMSVKEVHTEILKLLRGHQDLVDDFTMLYTRRI